jgi:hypothetical protein
MRPPQVNALLGPAQKLLADYDFWQHQSDGLALFLAPDVCETYRLPLAFTELVVVNRRFHLKPLLPLLSEDGQFYVLALSQNHVRLLQCTRHSVVEVTPPNMPASLAEALPYNDPERQRQFHTETAPFGPPSSGERGAIFFGTGAEADDGKTQIVEFLRLVDQGLHDVLRNEQAPLVLAGVEYLLPRYKEVTTYPHVVAAGVTGNPDGLRAEELHEQAWPVVEPLFRQHREDAADRYRHYAGTGRASNDLREVVAAAYYGRVETLFVTLGLQQWGTFHPDTQEVTVVQTPSLEHEDLLDTAALRTLINSGTVYAVPPERMPTDALLAAVFRY